MYADDGKYCPETFWIKENVLPGEHNLIPSYSTTKTVQLNEPSLTISMDNKASVSFMELSYLGL